MRAGDVLRVDFGVPVGSTPALVRPAVVVTADQTLSEYTATLHVVPVTTNVERAWRTDVLLDIDTGVTKRSVAQCHLCSVVDRTQIIDSPWANVGPMVLAQIRSVLADLLDIGD